MKKVLSLLIVISFSVYAGTATFAARGQPDDLGWYWSRDAFAEWQFFDLGWEGEHIFFVLTLETRGWNSSPPPSLTVTLTFSSFGCGKVIKTVYLQKVVEQGPFVRYFGQIVLPRRDLGFGSYLRVSLKAINSLGEVGIHRASLQLISRPALTAKTSYGSGGPFVPEGSGSMFEGSSYGQQDYLGIRECEDVSNAPYLAPGMYRGGLGWSGPGYPLDSHDWFRINARAGQLIELLVRTPQPLRLSLLNPSGQEVAHVEGQGLVGLIFEARDYGPYSACVAIFRSVPPFHYAVEVRLNR